RIYAEGECKFDEEFSRYKLILNTRMKDIPQTSVIDASLFAGGEIIELRRIRKQLDEIAKAPFTFTLLKKKGEKREEDSEETGEVNELNKDSGTLESLSDLKEFILANG